MSYQRSHKIMTYHLLEYCTYVVREFEADLYRQSGVEKLLVIPQGATLKCGDPVCNFITTLWWIIENTPEDIIFIADDDIKTFIYRKELNYNLTETYPNDYKEIATSEIERIAQQLYDLKLGLACDQATATPYQYYGPFEFKGMCGAIRWINKLALRAKYIQGDDAMSDIDMVMQELLLNRVIYQSRYFMAVSAPIGDGDDYTSASENYKFLVAMKNKWKKYFDYNFKSNVPKINVKR